MNIYPQDPSFPMLEYHKDVPINIVWNEYLAKGSTWVHWCNKHWYNLRVKIFEQGFWPYKIQNSLFEQRFHIFNGVALVHIQPFTIVDFTNPDIVYILDTTNIEHIMVKMDFSTSKIIMYEI